MNQLEILISFSEHQSDSHLDHTYAASANQAIDKAHIVRHFISSYLITH